MPRCAQNAAYRSYPPSLFAWKGAAATEAIIVENSNRDRQEFGCLAQSGYTPVSACIVLKKHRAIGWSRCVQLYNFRVLFLFIFCVSGPALSKAVIIDSFESATAPAPWLFYNGAEFPGAVGSLSRGQGHAGSGAHLAFNLSGGGNYVSADRYLQSPLNAAAIALWVKHPGGVNVQIRVTDSTGQTLQYSPTRPFESVSADSWYRLVVKLGPTTEHWGGNVNDGIVHNPIVKVSVLSQPGKTKFGAIDFDDVEAVASLSSLVDPSAVPEAAKVADFVGSVGVHVAARDTDTAGIDLAQSLGFKWTRVEMFWADIETTLHVYNFAKYDQFVSALATRGMKAHFILCYGNPLYTGPNWFSPPRTSSAIKGFADFAKNAATHFRGKGVQFEIWNEPDLAGFWNPPSAAEYAALTKATISAIHAADPQAKVSTGGLGGMNVTFVQSLIAEGGVTGADAVGVHPYRLEVPEKLGDELVLMRTMLAASFPTATPLVWSTECGYSSAWYGDGSLQANRTKQAKYSARQLLTGGAIGLTTDILFQLRDHGVNPWDSELNFGVVDFNREEKPLTSSVRTLLRQCASRTFNGTLASPHNAVHVLKFGAASDVLLVIWSETVGSGTEKISFPTAPSTAVNYLGTSVPVTAETGGTYSVQVGDSPVYAVFPQSRPPNPPTGLRVDTG